MKREFTTTMAAIHMVSLLAFPASSWAQGQSPNNEPTCANTSAGADPECVGFVSRGGIQDVVGLRAYVAARSHPQFSHADVRVGAVLPATGVAYNEVPQQFSRADVHYVVVNGHTVITDRKTHRILQIID